MNTKELEFELNSVDLSDLIIATFSRCIIVRCSLRSDPDASLSSLAWSVIDENKRHDDNFTLTCGFTNIDSSVVQPTEAMQSLHRPRSGTSLHLYQPSSTDR